MATFRVPIAELLRADSPRLSGEVPEHTQLLAELDQPLPPILVHRRTMQVIDGMHRLRAAILCGQETIEAVYFDGDDDEAFVLAVSSNIRHGLPLTRADREAAANRIIGSHPQYSDRAISAITGIAPATVAEIRRRLGVDAADSALRIGRDGRVRPVNSADARLVASRAIAENPAASLRQIARLAGLSPATVRDVRERMRRGDHPVPERERQAAGLSRLPGSDGPGRPPRSGEPGRLSKASETARPIRSRKALLDSLHRDPSLRFSESGRAMLRWLFSRTTGLGEAQELVSALPPHTVYLVSELARACADEWLQIADSLEEKIRDTA